MAVEDINITIPDGSYCCLLGPSGCGKTTLLRIIAGHEVPTEGDVLIGGESVIGKPTGQRGTSMMFQSYALFPHLTVLDNVAFSLKMKGVAKGKRRERAYEVLKRVQLDPLADPDAGAALGRAAAARRARPLADHQSQGAAARRAAVGARRVPAPADARAS